jgi:hypothetical protein
MEFALNTGWVLLAALMFCLWLRFGPRTGTDRRLQFVALALLILILFPVISVTDDLLAAQNPAEVDSCLRRDHATSTPHSIFPAAATLPPSIVAEIPFGFLRFTAPRELSAPTVDHPGLEDLQNRPPPAA